MKINKLLAALPLAALALLGVAGTPALADTAAVTSVQTSPSVTIHTDHTGNGFKLAHELSKVNEKDRDKFVRRAVDVAFEQTGGRYNVLLFNLSNNYQEQLDGKAVYANVDFDGVFYGLWVFDSGTFVNQGDGGYQNWGFRGWFDRNGGTVKFRRP
ncbi:hypothetical protein [Crossiella sp. CA198]|uniref:hypothetical protein n=1 Tax=Crossiella sp. CA198 TaxID=3455607 RepID=UPI003F8D5218